MGDGSDSTAGVTQLSSEQYHSSDSHSLIVRQIEGVFMRPLMFANGMCVVTPWRRV